MCQATTLTKACTLPMQFPCPSQNYCIGPFSIFSMMKIVKHFPCLLVQTISLSWVPIFPIYMKAHFLGAPYHNLLSLSLSLSLIHIWHSLKMDQRKAANIIIQFEELKVKEKKCNREQVLPPKRGCIKRRIFLCLIHKLMKITRGNVWFSRSIHQDLSLALYIYLNDLNITVMSFLLTLVLVPGH